MYNARCIHCANCGTFHVDYLDKNDILQFICNHCNVSVRSSFKKEKEDNCTIYTTYRYKNAIVNFIGLFCEHCGTQHEGKLNKNNEFAIICKCGASIKAKKMNSNDIKVSTRITKN